MSETHATPKGRRRPTEADLDDILARVSEGSLSAAARELGLDRSATYKWLHEDNERRQRYVRACAERAQGFIEDGLNVTRAAALGLEFNGRKVDASGARAYLEALKWAESRMAPKTPDTKILHHIFEKDPEGAEARIAELLAKAGGQAEEPGDGN